MEILTIEEDLEREAAVRAMEADEDARARSLKVGPLGSGIRIPSPSCCVDPYGSVSSRVCGWDLCDEALRCSHTYTSHSLLHTSVSPRVWPVCGSVCATRRWRRARRWTGGATR